MTTYTLAANTNVSALTLVDGDTIDCNGFKLSIDVQPTAININVGSPLKNGTVDFTGTGLTANLSTWTFTAGGAIMISSLPAGVTIGNAWGSATAGRVCVGSNFGTILNARGGAYAAGIGHGVNINFGTITTAWGNSFPGVLAYGVNSNLGTIGFARGDNGAACNTNFGIINEAFGGSVSSNSRGIVTNNGVVGTATGGSVFGAVGMLNNNGQVDRAVGGSIAGAFGVDVNNCQVFRATDNACRAVNDWNGTTKFVFGPEFQGAIVFGSVAYSHITTLYSIGTLSPLATIPPGVTVVTLKVDTGDTAESQFLRQIAESILAVIE